MQAPALRRFLLELTDIVKHDAASDHLPQRVGQAMRALLARDRERDDGEIDPPPGEYRQHLLYVDPDTRFSVVNFIWGAGAQTPIHDHTVWGVIGVRQGAETSTHYALAGPGEAMQERATTLMMPGDIELVSPTLGDIHQVRNHFDDRISASLHVYGADIGRLQRHLYDPLNGRTHAFVSGYSTRSALAL